MWWDELCVAFYRPMIWTYLGSFFCNCCLFFFVGTLFDGSFNIIDHIFNLIIEFNCLIQNIFSILKHSVTTVQIKIGTTNLSTWLCFIKKFIDFGQLSLRLIMIAVDLTFKMVDNLFGFLQFLGLRFKIDIFDVS